jgi:NTP pyrophosphatase (non-canonical NTP hydrolase)
MKQESKEKIVLNALLKNNNLEFNILKVIEECTELNEVLIKYLTKSEENKPSLEKIAEELGDAIFRSVVLAEAIPGLMELVEKRLDEKTDIMYKYMVENNGGKKLTITETNEL